MATPLGDTQSTPTTWTNWQAMRFLYQDINSLLYGGGLDLSQFSLPALNLPNYFNTFSLIQGTGSTNSGTGTGGGGGGTIVLPCDISGFISAPFVTLATYIKDQGHFTINNFVSAVDSSLRAGMLANAFALLTGPQGQLATFIITPDIHIEYSVPVCGSSTCPNLRNINLVFRTDAVVYLSGFPPHDILDLRNDYVVANWNIGYTLTADIGSNSFSQSVDFALLGPPSTLVGGSLGSSFGGGVSYALDTGVTWTQDDLRSIYFSSIQNLILKTPTLQSGFASILQQAKCS